MLSSVDQNSHPQIFYLHHNLKKFWEITIDPTSNSIQERFGYLYSNGQEDPTRIQTKTLFYKSWEETLNASQTSISQKNSEGFLSFDNPNISITNIENIPLTTSLIQNIQENPTTSERSKNLKRKPKEDLVRDDQKMVKKSSERSTKDSNDSLGAKVVSFFKNIFTYQSEDHVKTELPISTRVYRQTAAIEKKAESLNLRCKLYEDTVVVEGDARKVDLFEYFLKDLAEENAQKEIGLSNLPKGMHDLILQKAKMLNVYCGFFEKKLIMRGSQEHLDKLAEYLNDLEVTPQSSTFIKAEEIKIESIIKNQASSELLQPAAASSNGKNIVHGVKRRADLLENKGSMISEKRDTQELEKTREKYIYLGSKILEFYTPIGFFVPKAQHEISELA